MSFHDFKVRYSEYKKCTLADLDKMLPEHRYALQTRERGKGYVSLLQQVLRHGVSGKSVLDIGCAYGGICIEMAKAHAVSAGVEVISLYISQQVIVR